MRLIDADELMTELMDSDLDHLQRDDWREVIQIVQDAPTIQPQWIPCSERLPNVRQWVLCQCRAGIMDVLRLTADGSWNKNYPHTEYMSGFVVAWMPLPEPYKEGQE